jgi:septum site-determining protein MinC
MNKTVRADREPVCDIRFGQVGMAHVRPRTADPAALQNELSSRLAAAPHMLARAAALLDLSALDPKTEFAEIRALLEAIRRAGMLPVGLVQGGDSVDVLAQALDLPVLTPQRAHSKVVPIVQPTSEPPPPLKPEVVPEPNFSAQLHPQLVRSGQRVYARNRDLIITGGVGAGAEVMADGCVHVYGSLRGRALAGAQGDTTARMFCQEFHAELVSIGGVFRVFETIPAELAGKAVQAWLDGEHLHFARIGA